MLSATRNPDYKIYHIYIYARVSQVTFFLLSGRRPVTGGGDGVEGSRKKINVRRLQYITRIYYVPYIYVERAKRV